MKPGFDKPQAQSNPMVELILSEAKDLIQTDKEVNEACLMVELMLSEAKDLIQ